MNRLRNAKKAYFLERAKKQREDQSGVELTDAMKEHIAEIDAAQAKMNYALDLEYKIIVAIKPPEAFIEREPTAVELAWSVILLLLLAICHDGD